MMEMAPSGGHLRGALDKPQILELNITRAV